MTRPLLDATPDDLAGWMADRGDPAYRARQVLGWVFDRRAVSFEGMTDVPKDLRAALGDEWSVFGTTIVHHDIAPDGTEKLLLSCGDGATIECVVMAEADRRTACISTQVGCGMGCTFCASGLKGSCGT